MPIKVNMRDVMKNVQLQVQIKTSREYSIRLKAGLALLRLAGKILGCRVKAVGVEAGEGSEGAPEQKSRFEV